MTGNESIAQQLGQAMTERGDVHLIGESLPLSGTASPLLRAHPDRCHLLPAADATLVGIAIGLAMTGAKPVVELSGPKALWGALQQLGQESMGLQGEFAGTLVIRVPLRPDDMNPLAVLEGLQQITVACASNSADAAVLVQAALTQPRTTVLLEPITVLAASGGVAGPADFGKAVIVDPGTHVTIAAWGDGVAAAQSAARSLAADGIDAEVIDLRTLHPIDTETLTTSVRKTGRLVLVNGNATMLQSVTDQAFLRLESPPCIAGIDQIMSMARAAVHY